MVALPVIINALISIGRCIVKLFSKQFSNEDQYLFLASCCFAISRDMLICYTVNFMINIRIGLYEYQFSRLKRILISVK